MALSHGIPLFIHIADKEFTERPLGFECAQAEINSQRQHLDRLRSLGLDRVAFVSSERLSSQVLRSMSRLLNSSGTPVDKDSAYDLEAFAQLRESDEQGAEDSIAVIVPVHLELGLPPHLLLGQSVAIEFHLKEPGRTAVEHITIDFEIGLHRVSVRRDLLDRGQSVRLFADSPIVLEQEGTPPMRILLCCERSSIREKFEWQEIANVITAEALMTRTGIVPRSKPRPKKIRLQLVHEELRPRRGILDLFLQPVPAAGTRFDMGSPMTERGRQQDESQHPVRFSHSWWMAQNPISQAQYKAVMNNNPAKFHDQSDHFPIENVTWFEAVEFCEKLTLMEQSEDKLPLGFQYRLPTEAEWEFSCRAGDDGIPQTSSSRTGGSEATAITHAISTFPLDGNRGANRYGLCDMTGNVFQWCLDHYAPYPSDLTVDPCHKSNDGQRVVRGGSWYDAAPLRRPAARMRCAPETRSSRIGFRIVLARV